MRASRGAGLVLAAGLLLCGAAALGFGQTAGWRTVVAEHFSQNDFKGAGEYLQEAWPELEAADKAEACALLAYLNDSLGDRNQARKWLTQFFDTYGGPNVSFPFLGIVGEGSVEAFLNTWRAKFPQVTTFSLVWPKKNAGPMPPQTLQLGLDLTSDAYYRFSDASGILGGGILHKGFNILGIPADSFFGKSGPHPFILDLKAGDITLKKEVTITVRLSPEAEPPAQEKLTKTKGMIYELSFYVGQQLVVKSSKTEQASEALKLNIKPVNLRANPLFKPPGPRDPFDPNQMGVSIPGAIGVISGLIKDLVTKKPAKPESAIEKVSTLEFTFFRQGPADTETEVKATVSLETRSLQDH